MNKPLLTFWKDNEDNVGDHLTPAIVEHLLKRRVVLAAKTDTAKLLAVGSILGFLREDDVVWGTGCIKPRVILSPRGAKFLAVRGPLTREQVQDADVPSVYGDPGLLLPLVYNPVVEKAHKFGIIPHYVDEGQFLSSKEFIISVRQPWHSFVRELLSCDMIISSSLHGLVLAEAYGIPVVWAKYSDKIIGGTFKFFDYLLGTGRKIQQPSTSEVLPPLDNLKEIQTRLVEVLLEHY